MLEDHVGQVLKLKVHEVHDKYYDVRDVKNNTYQLTKTYCYDKKLALNSFVKLHVLKERNGDIFLSTKIPILNVGEIGALDVADAVNAGYFLNNGYELDVFLPADKSIATMERGDQAVVLIEQGKDHLLRATMMFDKIKFDEKVKIGSKIKARAINRIKSKTNQLRGLQFITNSGLVVFVAREEMLRIPHINEEVDVRILGVNMKDELEGTLKIHVKERNKNDIEVLKSYIIANNGVITLTEKSDPEDIKKELDMSKKAFKKAISGLLNNDEIEFKNHKIYAKQRT